MTDAGEGPSGEPSASLARDLLANERTLLAWIRTALGLFAAGIASPQLLQTSGDVAGTVIGVILVVLAGLTGLGGYRRFAAYERELRCGGELPGQGLAPRALAASVAAVAVVAVVLLLGTS